MYCATLRINTAIQVAERLYNGFSDNSCTGASLSTRSEFPVPNPRSKKPIQTAFPAARPEQTPWIDNGSMPFVVGSEPVYARKKHDYRKPNPRSDLS